MKKVGLQDLCREDKDRVMRIINNLIKQKKKRGDLVKILDLREKFFTLSMKKAKKENFAL
jgi:hypothetical protein